MSQSTEHRLTRTQYQRMVDAGVFHPEARVELIDGSIVQVTPQSSRHAAAIQLVQRAVQECHGTGFSVRVQMPLALGSDSAPEPDVAVVRGEPRDHRDAHPDTAVLVVEVADTSLAHDQGQKRNLYARAEIPEYWIVNLVANTIEVHREPSGGKYLEVTVHPRGANLVRAGASIRVDDLLP